MAASQRRATTAHRNRAKAHGIVRVEVQALAGDAAMIKAVAEILRNGSADADRLRKSIAGAMPGQPPRNALDIFSSELADETFEGVFDQARQTGWRQVDL
jgi:hypothetical protein